MSRRWQIVLTVALLALLASFALWGPVSVLYPPIDLVVRGRRLTDASDLLADYTIGEEPDELVAQASGVVGREVSKDAYALARMVRSEEPHQPDGVKELLCHVALNDAAENGWTVFHALTVSSNSRRSGYFGNQTSRRYSTVNDPYGSDLAVAEKVLIDRANGGDDPTGGAVKFFNRGALGHDWPDSWDSEGLVSENVDPAPDRLVFFTRSG